MKPVLLILFTILLSSCWPYYKQLGVDNKPVKTDIITLADCKIRISLEKKFRGDKDADYHVTLFFTEIDKDLNVNVVDISVKLFALKSGEEYSPVITRFFRNPNSGESAAIQDPVKAQAVHNGQVLNLKAGNRYSVIYSFAGHHRSKLKLIIEAIVNNEKISKTLVFEKFTEVELLH